jgi:SAM-dependent methyltransferase
MCPHYSEIFDRDQFRSNLLVYTRRAFQMLPPLDKPRILDIGCGTGVSTLEIARLSGGNVIALDIDRQALDRLVENASREGLSERITTVHANMLDMDFPPGSFDIIWSEGAISAVGFERGLREWRTLLVPEGYVVVHDALTDLQMKIQMTRTCGYSIQGRLELPPAVWWNEYYAPLRDRLDTLQQSSSSNRRIREEISAARREIKEFDPGDDRFGSVFFVLKKG